MALTDKQRAFIDHYLQSWNASEAARRAGYSEKTAYSIGARLLKNVEILAEKDRIVEERGMSRDEVVVRLAEQARGDIADFVTVWDGGFKIDIEKAIKAGKSHLIKKLGFNQYGKPEIELHNQQAALLAIGKIHSIFTDKVDHTGEVTHNVKSYQVVSPDDWDNDTNADD
jgi:phage terminase small subunit